MGSLRRAYRDRAGLMPRSAVVRTGGPGGEQAPLRSGSDIVPRGAGSRLNREHAQVRRRRWRRFLERSAARLLKSKYYRPAVLKEIAGKSRTRQGRRVNDCREHFGQTPKGLQWTLDEVRTRHMTGGL